VTNQSTRSAPRDAASEVRDGALTRRIHDGMQHVLSAAFDANVDGTESV
jgi:hypothetical protein